MLTKIAVVRSSQSLPPSLVCPILILLLAIPAISTSPSFAQTTQKTTLRLTDWADLDEMPLDEQAIAEFKRICPTIDIFYEPNPGRQYSTDVIVYHIYQADWGQLRMGYASAMSWVLFVIIVIATWIQFRIVGRNVEYG